MRWKPLTIVFIIGFFIRFLLFLNNTHSSLKDLPELSTPLTSFKRLKEGIFLFTIGKSPYEGDVSHSPPLLLTGFSLFNYMINNNDFDYFFMLLFTILDLFIAYGLHNIAHNALLLEEKSIINHDVLQNETEITIEEVELSQPISPLFNNKVLPLTIALLYLINPFTLFSCLALSTVGLTNIAIVMTLNIAYSSGNIGLTCFWLSIATYLSIYPVFLIIPLTFMIYQTKTRIHSNPIHYKMIIIKLIFSFGFWMTSFFYLSYKIMNDNWQFLEGSYIWIFKYTDLKPNVGLFWYFFTELFPRFKNYFLFLFHIHPIIYIIPLGLRISHRPLCYATMIIGIFSLFQAYPSWGNFGFFISILFIHARSIALMKCNYLMGFGIAVPCLLLPIMWYLWLYAGSGNANFYYFQTLIYNFFICLFITNFLSATIKRDICLIKTKKQTENQKKYL